MEVFLSLRALPSPEEFLPKDIVALEEAVRTTPEKVLLDCIEASGDDYSYGVNNIDQFRDLLLVDVRSLIELADSQSAVFFYQSEMPFGYYLAGGTSGGDPASDYDGTFLRLAECKTVFCLLRRLAFEWAEVKRGFTGV